MRITAVSYTHLDVYKRQVVEISVRDNELFSYTRQKKIDHATNITGEMCIRDSDKGIARIDDLPLGKYYLVETKTIDGFVLDDTPIEADLSYIDQNKKFVFAGMDVTNERQKVQITVTKTDSETKEALEGAVFGLFAKEDIVNKDGKVIVKADTQIERTVTGKDGKAAFTSDLPLGQYYVKEILSLIHISQSRTACSYDQTGCR